MSEATSPYASVGQVVAAFQSGTMVMLLDETGEGTGVMACAAAFCDDLVVNELSAHARGLVCVGLSSSRAAALGLALQSEHAGAPAFTVSVEAAEGVTTGISTKDRARTIAVLADPQSRPADLVSPGHVFPVRAHPAGVLARRGAAEAVVDLAAAAGLPSPAGVFCHVLAANGDEANRMELEALAARLSMPLLRIGDLVCHRTRNETLVRRMETGQVPTAWGLFDVSVFEELMGGTQHVLLQIGDPEPTPDRPAPLVRVHSQCLTGDVFGSHRCDCGTQLDTAMRMIAEAGQGALLYLRQEGRGIGLVAKLKAYALQDRGRDTVEANEELGFEADQREYGIGAQILYLAGYTRLRLLTNNPRKVSGLQAVGLDVVERLELTTDPLPENLRYLRAKKEKLGHILPDLH